MNNTNISPERLKKIAESLRQPTPEETKETKEQLREMMKAANENMKAGRWHNMKEQK